MDAGTKLDFLRRVAEAGEQASMWAIGEAMGYDRSDTEYICMEIMGEGLLEIVNLSGIIRLTQAGLGKIGAGGGREADDLAGLVNMIRQAGELGLSEEDAGDFQADLDSLEAQSKRSKPMASVVSACLEALGQALANASGSQAAELANKIKVFEQSL